MKTIKLNNGIEMPQIGYGVYQIIPSEVQRCVEDALSVGYRMIDTAQAYHNEEGVGQAIKHSQIRKDIFLVSKIWLNNYGYEKAKRSIDESLQRLQTDYIDLMLLHQPFCDYYGAYRAMEEALKEGKLRSIGLANFYADRFIDLASNVEIAPAVNQVEMNIFYQRDDIQKYMQPFDTTIMSWAPFAEGKNNFFTNEILKQIGEKYNKSIAQTALRFLIQKNAIVIPKSTHKERMQENLNILDFELSNEDMSKIKELDMNTSLFLNHHDPEAVKMFMQWRENI
ncbi:MAG: aldo/keto reductase [Bacteroidota bacterium]|nr:aldo/keto reductase [Bacteroidota bacterium]